MRADIRSEFRSELCGQISGGWNSTQPLTPDRLHILYISRITVTIVLFVSVYELHCILILYTGIITINSLMISDNTTVCILTHFKHAHVKKDKS